MSVSRFVLEKENNLCFRFYVDGSFICRMTKAEMIKLHNLLGVKVEEPPVKKELQWQNTNEGYLEYDCPVCKNKYHFSNFDDDKWNYCPNCGTKLKCPEMLLGGRYEREKREKEEKEEWEKKKRRKS